MQKKHMTKFNTYSMIQSFSKLGTKNFLNLIKGIYIYLQQYLSRYVSSGKGNKSKNKQMGLHQNKKLLHSKGNNK